MEGPKPHIESRLCMLLSLVPLACVIVIDEEEKAMSSSGGNSRGDIISTSNGDEKDKSRQGTRRAALASSLQALGQFEALLYTPQIAVAAANQAAQSIASILANVNASSMLSSENNTMPKSAGSLLTIQVPVSFDIQSEQVLIFLAIYHSYVTKTLCTVVRSWKHETLNCGGLYFKRIT